MCLEGEIEVQTVGPGSWIESDGAPFKRVVDPGDCSRRRENAWLDQNVSVTNEAVLQAPMETGRRNKVVIVGSKHGVHPCHEMIIAQFKREITEAKTKTGRCV